MPNNAGIIIMHNYVNKPWTNRWKAVAEAARTAGEGMPSYSWELKINKALYTLEKNGEFTAVNGLKALFFFNSDGSSAFKRRNYGLNGAASLSESGTLTWEDGVGVGNTDGTTNNRLNTDSLSNYDTLINNMVLGGYVKVGGSTGALFGVSQAATSGRRTYIQISGGFINGQVNIATGDPAFNFTHTVYANDTEYEIRRTTSTAQSGLINGAADGSNTTAQNVLPSTGFALLCRRNIDSGGTTTYSGAVPSTLRLASFHVGRTSMNNSLLYNVLAELNA